MVGVPYGTSLAGNPFEKGIAGDVKIIQSDAPEKNLKEIQFDTGLPADDTFVTGTEDPLAMKLTSDAPEKNLEQTRFETSLPKDPRWLGRLRDYLRSCLSTVQVIIRRGLLLLSEQGMHLLEHWKRIVSRLCANEARATEALILWLVLVSTVFVLVGGVVSDIWLTSHASGVIQSSSVQKAAVKTKIIMPVNVKLIARPVADPTVMSTPQRSISSSAFAAQPNRTPP
jgi:hypothetical protein